MYGYLLCRKRGQRQAITVPSSRCVHAQRPTCNAGRCQQCPSLPARPLSSVIALRAADPVPRRIPGGRVRAHAKHAHPHGPGCARQASRPAASQPAFRGRRAGCRRRAEGTYVRYPKRECPTPTPRVSQLIPHAPQPGTHGRRNISVSKSHPSLPSKCIKKAVTPDLVVRRCETPPPPSPMSHPAAGRQIVSPEQPPTPRHVFTGRVGGRADAAGERSRSSCGPSSASVQSCVRFHLWWRAWLAVGAARSAVRFCPSSRCLHAMPDTCAARVVGAGRLCPAQGAHGRPARQGGRFHFSRAGEALSALLVCLCFFSSA